MAGTANIRAVITAEDKASAVVKQFSTNVDKSTDKIVESNKRSGNSFAALAVATAGAVVASRSLVGIINDSVTAANKEQNALLGLISITKAFSVDTDKATQAAEDLRKDGLMSLADAARGLKNLLQAGFSLDQAITLMTRFKDSAAFGRQSALSFGEAVASATEGIKNGNSILVDNAGVTKNLSVILEEAGFSAQDLMRSTSDASVRQALFNGIVKETNAQVGDASKLTETYAGRQANLSAETENLKARLGEALQPALARVLEAIKPVVEKFAEFAEKHPTVVAAALLIGVAVTGLIALLGTLGLAIIGLSPLFAAMGVAGSAAFGLVTTAAATTLGAVQTLVAYVGGGAAAAGFAAFGVAAVAGFIKVRNEIDELNKAIDGANESIKKRDINAYIKTYEDIKKRDPAAAKRFAEMQSRATGGPVLGGETYLVGEEGPEIITPQRSGTVIPAPQSAAMMGGGSTSINVNIGMYAGSQMEKRRVAEELLKALKDIAQSKNTTVGQMMGM